MRNYQVMRAILDVLRKATEPKEFNDFAGLGSHEEVCEELIRLSDEGLIKEKITTKNYIGVEISGLTKEGNDFAREIENGKVFAIIYGVLKDADLDLSYPLLRDVCDEIVKRYVMSKIPDSF